MSQEDPLLSFSPKHKTLSKENLSNENGIQHDRANQSCIFILLVVFAERMAFYGILSNLVLYLHTRLSKSQITADSISMMFVGLSYSTSFVGGWLADSAFGRFKTILFLSMFYIIGSFMLLLSALNMDMYPNQPDIEERKKTSFLLALIGFGFAAIGVGGHKPNVSTFGAEQFSECEQECVQKFFSKFYWMVNLGSLISFTVIAFIQQNISFHIGYAICFLGILLSIMTLYFARSLFFYRKPSGVPFTDTLNVFMVGLKHSIHDFYSWISCRSLQDRNASFDSWSSREHSFDVCKESHGGKFQDSLVEDVKTLAHILPILACFLLYWTMYNQMTSTMFNQGRVMNLLIFSCIDMPGCDEQKNKLVLPIATLNVFNVVAVLTVLPIVDSFVYPWLRNKGIRLTLLRRIAIGMFLSSLSMLCAGIIEHHRLGYIASKHTVTQKVNNEVVVAADMSVFWQIPQFVLLGTSEVFASVAGLEFAFDQAPESMRSFVMSLYLLTNGIGSSIGAAILAVVNSVTRRIGKEWIPNDVNNGSMNSYFYFLFVLMLLNLACFIQVAKSYTYKRKKTSSQKFDSRDKDRFFKNGSFDSLLPSGAPQKSRSMSGQQYGSFNRNGASPSYRNSNKQSNRKNRRHTSSYHSLHNNRSQHTKMMDKNSESQSSINECERQTRHICSDPTMDSTISSSFSDSPTLLPHSSQSCIHKVPTITQNLVQSHHVQTAFVSQQLNSQEHKLDDFAK